MCYLKLILCSLLFFTITTAAPIDLQTQNITNSQIFIKYADNLMHPKILGFLSECLPKPTNRKGEIFCNAYFDMLTHLNEVPTLQTIYDIQNNSARNEIIENFCTNFKENIPKTSNVTMYEKDVEQFYEIIVVKNNCDAFCLELNADMEKSIKQKCILISWGYNSIAKKRLTDSTTQVTTNLSKITSNEVIPVKPDSNAIVPEITPVEKVQEEIKKAVDGKIKEETPKDDTQVLYPKDNTTHLKQSIQIPNKTVSVAPQSELSADDVKPLDTIPSSEKTEIKSSVEPINPIGDEFDAVINSADELPDNSVVADPNEDTVKKSEKVEDVITESVLNLNENGNDNNPFDNNSLDAVESNDEETDDDDSGVVPDDFEGKHKLEEEKMPVLPVNIQHKDDYVLADNPKEDVSDPFFADGDSNFFTYFMLIMLLCIIVYVGYHNKSKVLALVLEGRRGSNSRGGSGRRKHTAAYRKLDSNLEEAITSGASSRASQIIY